MTTPNWAVLDFMNTDYHQVTHLPTLLEWIPHFPTPPENVARLADADLKRECKSYQEITINSGTVLMTSPLYNRIIIFYYIK
uniref:Sulfatase domain-containing protein n=1 Tax=Heterorhabditis bacteriophora TaxID=37862 RepID=A0A1I7WHP4_HETBA